VSIKSEQVQFEIKSEITPSTKIMEVITFSTPLWIGENKFGLLTRDLQFEKIPEFD
jgi:hypothetical protein